MHTLHPRRSPWAALVLATLASCAVKPPGGSTATAPPINPVITTCNIS